MSGLFEDGQEHQIQVDSDSISFHDLEPGRVILLKKQEVKLSLAETVDHEPILLIHRLVGKFFDHSGEVYFWEKGDNDCFPKVCRPDNILGMVIDIDDYPELLPKLDPLLWREKNRKLIRFYKLSAKIWRLIPDDNIDPKRGIMMKIQKRIFWGLLYLVCSVFDLKGK